MKQAKQTSFFYLLMALGCFDRARRARHGTTLRNIGRNYLFKATNTTSGVRISSIDRCARAVSKAA